MESKTITLPQGMTAIVVPAKGPLDLYDGEAVFLTLNDVEAVSWKIIHKSQGGRLDERTGRRQSAYYATLSADAKGSISTGLEIGLTVQKPEEAAAARKRAKAEASR